ncbi:MAG: magnesium transporter CorA family protein [Candidatus Izemoplasmatales bacterium]|nr:magnesium transporter CorA family protein [Candidatus Izemoplasmatales bacterium]
MITVYNSSTSSELSVFKSIDETNIYEKIKPKCWIYMIAPTEEEISKVSQITGIFESMIRTSLDEEETAHIDIDDDVTLLVVDTPVVQVDVNYPEINHFYTMPLGIIFNEKYIITTCLKKDIVVPSLINRLMKNFSTNKHIKLTIQILYRNAANFVTMLKQLNKDSEHVQSKLQESLKNIELFELMNLGKSLVYLSTGLNADILVLEKIKRLEAFKQFEDDVDLIDDAIVENRQAMEMCSIHRDILNGTMDAYASIISNNVNTVMKTLTVVTIVLTIPTLVASIFGMNFDLPFQQNGFWIAIIISIVMASIGGFLLARYTGKTKSRRRNK